MSIIDNIFNLIEEVKGLKQKVVRGGKIRIKFSCPPGTRSVGNGKCIRMGVSEKLKRAKAAIKAARTRAKHAGINKMHMEKARAKSMRIRELKHVKSPFKSIHK
jgi:hypothetical protein